jgi:hypothetical protein
MSMPALGAELYDLTLRVVNGEYSVGERAGHAQVSIWRNWPQAGPTDVSQYSYGPRNAPALALSSAAAAAAAAGRGAAASPALTFPGYPSAAPRGSCAVERIGLILPTSLCSGEVARTITLALNASLAAGAPSSAPLALAVSRFECLPHTEGCGTGYPEGGIEQYSRVMLGHLTHPSIALALCLEHGCEKTHNDFFSNAMRDAGLSTASVGFASIQLDGGIEAVTEKVRSYFVGAATAAAAAPGGGVAARAPCDVRSLDIGLVVAGGERAAATGERSVELALAASHLAKALCAGGGSLVLPANSPLLRNPLFTDDLQLPAPADADSPCPVAPTLAFGEAVRRRSSSSSSGGGGGVHIMDMPFVKDYSETVTGLAAVGVHAVLVLSFPSKRGAPRPTPGHPIVPVVHVGLGGEQQGAAGAAAAAGGGGGGSGADAAYAASVDALYRPPAGSTAAGAGEGLAWAALEALAAVAGGGVKAKASAAPFFSITRGPTGVST